jgi:hypothetical protein
MKIKVKREKNDVKREACLGENGQYVLYGQRIILLYILDIENVDFYF